MLLGEYNYNLDAKGRVFVPAKLRDDLGETFVVAKSMDKCISIYSLEMWQKYVDKLNSIPEMRARYIRRFVYSSAVEASCDAQGRVVLPQGLREHAALERELVVIGAGDHAEIWNAEIWSSYMGEGSAEGMIETLMEFGF